MPVATCGLSYWFSRGGRPRGALRSLPRSALRCCPLVALCVTGLSPLALPLPLASAYTGNSWRRSPTPSLSCRVMLSQPAQRDTFSTLDGATQRRCPLSAVRCPLSAACCRVPVRRGIGAPSSRVAGRGTHGFGFHGHGSCSRSCDLLGYSCDCIELQGNVSTVAATSHALRIGLRMAGYGARFACWPYTVSMIFFLWPPRKRLAMPRMTFEMPPALRVLDFLGFALRHACRQPVEAKHEGEHG